MESLLQNPETRALWTYFMGLSRIPRGSKAEAAAADWVAEQGRALGCQVERDPIGNVLIRKPGTYSIQVNATGNWQIEIRPEAAMPPG